MWTLIFWKSATERAVKTSAQVVGVTYFADAVGTIEGMSLGVILSVAAYAGIASYLTSLASAPVGDDSPSLVQTSGSRINH